VHKRDSQCKSIVRLCKPEICRGIARYRGGVASTYVDYERSEVIYLVTCDHKNVKKISPIYISTLTL